jgi:hypothetical protein
VLGEIEVRLPDGTVTVKVTALLVPAADVTVTFLAPPAAPAVNVNVAVTEVSLTTVTALTVTPPPETFTAVVPVNPVPARVTGTVTPGLPDAGVIDESTGPLIVNGRVLLAPAEVTTSMFTLPIAALVVLVKVAVIEVALTKATLVMVKPGTAGVATTVDPAIKFVPVRVTFTDVPRSSELGVMDVSVGPAAATTVNVTALVVPFGVLTVTFRTLNEAVAEMVKVAVTSVALTAAKLLTVIPPPVTFTAVAPVRLWPTRVTFTTVPGDPEFGVIELRVGLVVLRPWYSIAPTSTRVRLPGSGRGFPKKSALGCG